MKAVLLDKPGPPSSLRIGEISIPRPGVDEQLFWGGARSGLSADLIALCVGELCASIEVYQQELSHPTPRSAGQSLRHEPQSCRLQGRRPGI